MRTRFLAAGLCALAALAPAPHVTAAELSEADLAALRYFLSINDQASVQAEIERLQTEFPGADVQGTLSALDAVASQIDTTPIWRRIDADEYDEAHQLIAEVKAQNPGWTPPEELVSVLDAKEGQALFETAYAAQDLPAAIAVLADHPTILTCERINNPWRLAEMQRDAALTADALSTYDGILKICREEDFVVATLQKASEITRKEQLVELFGVARAHNPELTPRLADLEEELMPAPQSAAPAPAPSSAGAGGPSPVVARAKAAADRGDWSTCLAVTANVASIDAVNQRAWCAFNFGRTREAIQAFGQVAQRGSGSMARDASYGMILAYAQLGQLDQAASLAGRTKLTSKQRQVVNRTVISKLAVQSFEAGHYRETLTYIDRVQRETGSIDRGLAMLRGWALLKSGRRAEARSQFRRIHDTSPGDDSHRGLVQAR